MQNPARFLVVRPKLHLVLKVLAHQSSSCIRHLVASNRLLVAQSPEAIWNLKLGHHISKGKINVHIALYVIAVWKFWYISILPVFNLKQWLNEVICTYHITLTLKSVHFTKAVARISFLSNLWYFQYKSKQKVLKFFVRNEIHATVFLKWSDFSIFIYVIFENRWKYKASPTVSFWQWGGVSLMINMR